MCKLLASSLIRRLLPPWIPACLEHFIQSLHIDSSVPHPFMVGCAKYGQTFVSVQFQKRADIVFT
jgi:hypothetical protein